MSPPASCRKRKDPPLAEVLLIQAGYSEEADKRAACLVSRHHTYTGIDAPDYQILVKADFLVNFYENQNVRWRLSPNPA